MRYNLILEQSRPGQGVKLTLLGRADNREHAEQWARTRLRRADTRYGDKVQIHPVGHTAPSFTIE